MRASFDLARGFVQARIFWTTSWYPAVLRARQKSCHYNGRHRGQSVSALLTGNLGNTKTCWLTGVGGHLEWPLGY